MKLKRLVTISLIVFLATFTTIIGVGFIVPSNPASKLEQNSLIINDTSSNKSIASSDTGNEVSPGSVSTNANSAANTNPSSISNTVSNTTPASSPTSTPTPTPSPTPTPTPSPTPTPCGSAGGVCTSAQVAQHNTSNNCWVIYGGNYYIVTSYINNHPGGTSVFNSETCGRDITGYLNGSKSTAGESKQHPSSAYTILNSYKVGPVQG